MTETPKTDVGQGTPTQAVQLLDGVEALTHVLERENDAIRGRNTEDVRALASEKASAARTYEALVGLLTADDGATGTNGIGDTDRAALAEASRRLDGAMAENTRLLAAALETHRRFMDAVADAARAAQKGPETYSNTGAVAGGGRVAGRIAAPVSIDQAL